MVKIYGIRRVAHEMKNIPPGFHVDIWACKNGENYKVWASELLTSESWTEYEKRPDYLKLNYVISEYIDRIRRKENRTPSITECINEAIRIAFLEDE